MSDEEFLSREFALVLEERARVEKKEQEEFLLAAKAQLQEDLLAEYTGLTDISSVIQKKVIGKYASGMHAIEEKTTQVKKKTSPAFFNAVMTNVFHILKGVVRSETEFAFRAIMKHEN